jgi:hypothetical protein
LALGTLEIGLWRRKHAPVALDSFLRYQQDRQRRVTHARFAWRSSTMPAG